MSLSLSKKSSLIAQSEIRAMTYEYFLYDGRKHISPASLPGMAERTITISGYSKTFSITGWRIGYTVSHAKWAQMIGETSKEMEIC